MLVMQKLQWLMKLYILLKLLTLLIQKVVHEAPFFHNDKLSQSSDDSGSENSDDETVYGWSTDDDTEEYSFPVFDTDGSLCDTSDAEVFPTNS